MRLSDVMMRAVQRCAVRKVRWTFFGLVPLLVMTACMGGSWSETDYQEKVANAAEAARSSVQTAKLVVEAADEGKAPGAYTARTLSDSETSLASVATQIGSVQPPTAKSTALRGEVTSLLDECRTVLGDLRIAARDGHFDELSALAEPLPRLAGQLQRFQRLRPT
jgi:hypothetical protein